MTPTERLAYDTLLNLTELLDRPPSLAEIGERMGITKAGAQRHLDSLKKMGAIQGPKIEGNWRALPLGEKIRQQDA